MDTVFHLDEHGEPTLRRPAGLPKGERGERVLLSALAREMAAKRGAQEMVKDLLRELVIAERRAKRAEFRLHLADIFSAPTNEEAEIDNNEADFARLGFIAYALIRMNAPLDTWPAELERTLAKLEIAR